ncbi:MAG: hypothetical protein ACT4QA_18615 [Panacagrimonas sp.]
MRAVSLSDLTDTPPMDLPVTQIQYLTTYNANGLLRFMLAYDPATQRLLRFTPDLRSSVVLAENVAEYSYANQAPDGTLVLRLNGALRVVRSNGVLVRRPLRRPQAGYEILDVLLDGNDVFFGENAIRPASPAELPRHRTRIYRVPLDGSAKARLLINLRVPGQLRGLTDTRLIYTAGGVDVVAGQLFFSPRDLVSLARDGAGRPLRLHRVQTRLTDLRDLHVSMITGNRVFYFETRADGIGTDLEQRAYNRFDTGALVANHGRGSVRVGTHIPQVAPVHFNWSAASPQDAPGRLLLARRGIGGGTRGAQLLSVNPETLVEQRIARLPDTDQIPQAATNSAGAMVLCDRYEGIAPSVRIGLLDLYGNRFFAPPDAVLFRDSQHRSEFMGRSGVGRL